MTAYLQGIFYFRHTAYAVADPVYIDMFCSKFLIACGLSASKLLRDINSQQCFHYH